jgi:hypothetical protein
VTYTASVGVGSPATDYTLLIDTGSSNTWVGAQNEIQEHRELSILVFLGFMTQKTLKNGKKRLILTILGNLDTQVHFPETWNCDKCENVISKG